MAYNGWINFETWAVNIWLADWEETVAELTAQAWDETEARGRWSHSQEASRALADKLREFVESEMLPALEGSSLQADLLGAAASEINWDELAAHYVADFEPEEKEEEEESIGG